MKLHSFTIPDKDRSEGKLIVLMEMSAEQHLINLEAAADAAGESIGKAASAEIKMRRRTCLREYDGRKVDRDTSVEELLAVMSAKEQGFMDTALRYIHDVTGDESELFLMSHTVVT